LGIVKKWGRYALLLLVLAVLVTGCMPGRTVSNVGWTVVTAEDGIVYTVLPTGEVLALDAEKEGEVLWRYPPKKSGGGGLGCSIVQKPEENASLPLDAVYGIPALAGDLLLVTSYDQHLYAFDKKTGEIAWTFPIDEEDGALVGGVTLYDGIAYFGSSDHKVYALDLASQKLVWEKPFTTGNRVWGEPAVDEEHVYVGSMDHYVYAIDRQTGELIWKKDIGASVPGAVTLANGILFVGGVDRRLHALDARDGSELWQTEELGGWVWGEALVHQGYVYFTSLEGTLHARSVADGTPRWRPVSLDSPVRAGPVIIDGHLLLGTEAGALFVVDMEKGSRERFYTDLKGSVLSRPAVVGKMAYVGTAVGHIYALDYSRRDPLVWEYPPPKK